MNSNIIAFAIDAHHKVNHLYDGKPYSLHLAMVAHYAVKYIDLVPQMYWDVVINAAWLHDTIEDCRLTYNDIKSAAGEEVAEIVYALTNDKGKNRKQRAGENYYKGIRDTPYAGFVKLCDRIANVRYSLETNSKMLNVYQKENDGFIKGIGVNQLVYKQPLTELNQMINLGKLYNYSDFG